MTDIVTVAARRPATVIVVPALPPLAGNRLRVRRAHRAVAAFAVTFVAFTAGLSLLLEGPLGRLRDPEYAARRDALVARVREHPARPVVLVLGSSRTVEGIRPDAVHGDDGPMLLNGGLIGSGSMLQLLSYRRLKDDGVRPVGVLLEYWPAMLRGGNYAESGRINAPRLGLRDIEIVRDYFPDPPGMIAYVAESQLWPAWRYRRPLLALVRPKWVPNFRHETRYAGGIDDWGWWPGVRDEDAEIVRTRSPEAAKNPFRPYLDGYTLGVEADRAFRDLLNECRADGVAVAFVFMPESPAFRTLYSPDADRAWRSHLDGIARTYGTPVLDARAWDEFAPDLPDDVHLTRGGATRFSRRLAAELPRLFPALAGSAP